MNAQQKLQQFRKWADSMLQWLADQNMPVEVAFTLSVRAAAIVALHNGISLDVLKQRADQIFDACYEDFATPKGAVH